MKELEAAEIALKPVKEAMSNILDTLKGEEKFILTFMAERLPECGEVLTDAANCKNLQDYNNFFQAMFEVKGIIEIFDILKSQINE